MIAGIESYLCQHLRVREVPMDNTPVVLDFTSKVTHIPFRRFQLSGIHHWNIAVGRILQETPQGCCYSPEQAGSTVLHAYH